MEKQYYTKFPFIALVADQLLMPTPFLSEGGDVWGLLIRAPERLVVKPQYTELICTQVKILHPKEDELKAVSGINIITGVTLFEFMFNPSPLLKADGEETEIITTGPVSSLTGPDIIIEKYQPLLHLQFDFSKDCFALIHDIKVIAKGPDFVKPDPSPTDFLFSYEYYFKVTKN